MNTPAASDTPIASGGTTAVPGVPRADEPKMAAAPATVYLVGAGPGDAGLLTLRALECLQQASCVVYDYLASDACMRFANPQAETIFVGKKGFCAHVTQPEINACLVDAATRHASGSVVRLKGGDPYVFGRGGEEALALRAAGIPFEVVPGVTAAVAACAYAGIPVTHRTLASSVALITGHETPDKDAPTIDWNQVANGADTLCFYMGIRDLPQIAEKLMAAGRGPQTPVALVRWGTTPAQEVLEGTLATIVQQAQDASFTAPAIIVVGKVVALRRQLSWFDKRPLFGKRVVVTRTREQASTLVARLGKLGADVVEFPTIEVRPRVLDQALRDTLKDVGTYDWVVFTSANGVTTTFGHLASMGLDARALSGAKVAAIGPATAEALAGKGIAADLVPERFVAESVAEALLQNGVGRGSAIAILRASAARDTLPELLQEAGAHCSVHAVYDTVVPDASQQAARVAQLLAEGAVDAVTFTSSSTARNFAQLIEGSTLGRPVAECLGVAAAISIGPITTRTLAELGIACAAEADPYTADGLVEALCAHFGAG